MIPNLFFGRKEYIYILLNKHGIKIYIYIYISCSFSKILIIDSPLGTMSYSIILISVELKYYQNLVGWLLPQ